MVFFLVWFISNRKILSTTVVLSGVMNLTFIVNIKLQSVCANKNAVHQIKCNESQDLLVPKVGSLIN